MLESMEGFRAVKMNEPNQESTDRPVSKRDLFVGDEFKGPSPRTVLAKIVAELDKEKENENARCSQDDPPKT